MTAGFTFSRSHAETQGTRRRQAQLPSALAYDDRVRPVSPPMHGWSAPDTLASMGGALGSANPRRNDRSDWRLQGGLVDTGGLR